jgi:farnesyl diphosphate synthase
LVLAAREAVANGVQDKTLDAAALRAACAVELIHAYSLVHDDMPCMDNDVLRRGKPTVHVHFGEAQALLAGDALQALAFELLTPENNPTTGSHGLTNIPDEVQARLCRLLAKAAGFNGMAGGQAIDLASVGLALNEQQLREMHRLKTGALLSASVMMGAACGNISAQTWGCLERYGQAMGLAFQVVDDVLDVTADSVTLGKTAGKDAANDKPTYVSLLGLAQAQEYAEQLLHEALKALEDSGLKSAHSLAALAQRVVNRKT